MIDLFQQIIVVNMLYLGNFDLWVMGRKRVFLISQ
jgi:hypothetical protein